MLLKKTGAIALTGLLPLPATWGRTSPAKKGYIKGAKSAEDVAQQIFADGGNAFDAIVAGALAAAVAAPNQTGIAGYGGTAVLATGWGKKIAAVDFNSTAPAAATRDMFARSDLPPQAHMFGWLAAGVPGVLAGLQHIIDGYATRPFSELVQPAIDFARNGVVVTEHLARAIKVCSAQFEKDPGSRRLFFRDGKRLAAGDRLKNPALAEVLATLAQRNSVESFYRGDIAGQIAEAFRKNGGLVTAADMAAFKVLEAAPLVLSVGSMQIHTHPLTAGGISVLQALKALQIVKADKLVTDFAGTHARIEALRLAWRDRLTLLGDPAAVEVPVARLLSDDYAEESARQIEEAVEAGRIVPHAVESKVQDGTIHLSAADEDGNFIAMTLTHGGGFGARVTADGLGLTLGHGMSRFDIRADHPNSPGPGKRPLHNMCPTVVTRDGRAVLAIGGAGGRRIPNALHAALAEFAVNGKPIASAVAAPRVHTEGTASIECEAHWPAENLSALPNVGYKVTTGKCALVSAAAYENGAFQVAGR